MRMSRRPKSVVMCAASAATEDDEEMSQERVDIVMHGFIEVSFWETGRRAAALRQQRTSIVAPANAYEQAICSPIPSLAPMMHTTRGEGSRLRGGFVVELMAWWVVDVNLFILS